MMVGIDRRRHRILIERIERLEELSVHNRDGELRAKHWELEKQMHLLSEQFTRYNALMQELAVIVETYSKLYSDTSMSAYHILRKMKVKKRA